MQLHMTSMAMFYPLRKYLQSVFLMVKDSQECASFIGYITRQLDLEVSGTSINVGDDNSIIDILCCHDITELLES